LFKEVNFQRKSEYEVKFNKINYLKFLYDIDVSYRGTIDIFLSTYLLVKIPYFHKVIRIPLNCEIKVLSLNGTVRLYYNGNENGESWYAFLGEPVMDFDVNIIIGEENKLDINISTVFNYFLHYLD
jgi:hypothetical protein